MGYDTQHSHPNYSFLEHHFHSHNYLYMTNSNFHTHSWTQTSAFFLFKTLTLDSCLSLCLPAPFILWAPRLELAPVCLDQCCKPSTLYISSYPPGPKGVSQPNDEQVQSHFKPTQHWSHLCACKKRIITTWSNCFHSKMWTPDSTHVQYWPPFVRITLSSKSVNIIPHWFCVVAYMPCLSASFLSIATTGSGFWDLNYRYHGRKEISDAWNHSRNQWTIETWLQVLEIIKEAGVYEHSMSDKWGPSKRMAL